MAAAAAEAEAALARGGAKRKLPPPAEKKKRSAKKKQRKPKDEGAGEGEGQGEGEGEGGCSSSSGGGGGGQKESAEDLGSTITVFCKRDIVRYLNWKRAKLVLEKRSAITQSEKKSRKSFNSILSEHDGFDIPAYLLEAGE